MRLLIIRHGDPDYENDTLTDRGKIEAAYLAERMTKENVKDFYVSPLGRAALTAKYTLDRLERKGTTCEWLREFAPRIDRPDRENAACSWDWLPADWTPQDEFYDADHWTDNDTMAASDVKEQYDWVCREFDALLEKYGYVRENRYYRVKPGMANNDTIAFFCHFGLECVLISRLLSVSPMPLWHGFCAAPTSVTTIYTEERREGIASFRIAEFGNVDHLNASGMEPSKHAR
ncbi:MAG: histidine phosphatase family protein, partial [Lachnospiraceae bacterium]|nr:histidine phosphatase family protein [Lachnospiraceae bacterium]